MSFSEYCPCGSLPSAFYWTGFPSQLLTDLKVCLRHYACLGVYLTPFWGSSSSSVPLSQPAPGSWGLCFCVSLVFFFIFFFFFCFTFLCCLTSQLCKRRGQSSASAGQHVMCNHREADWPQNQRWSSQHPFCFLHCLRNQNQTLLWAHRCQLFLSSP